MFFSRRKRTLKLLKYTILAVAVGLAVVFLALLLYIEPLQPNVEIQANTRFDIERYILEDEFPVSKTDNMLKIKLKSEKYYQDLTLKLDSQYLNFSSGYYIHCTYNNSNTIAKPAGFIPPFLIPAAGDTDMVTTPAILTPHPASQEEEIYTNVYDGLICDDYINENYLIYNTSNHTGFIYDGVNNNFYSADIKLCYEHENFTLYQKEEKTFCFLIDYSRFPWGVPHNQKNSEITIEIIDNNGCNLDKSNTQITKFINRSVPSAKIKNLCNNIVKYVSGLKSNKQIKTLNYNFGEISTIDEIKLWFILFVPKYVEFLNMNVGIQNQILNILEGCIIKALGSIIKVLILWQGLSSEDRLLFVTFLYVLATVAIACFTYRSRPILMKAIEEHTLRLRKLAEDWLKEITFDNVEKPLSECIRKEFQIEKEFLFDDLKLHIPKEINMLDLWEKFKININGYNKLKYELYKELLAYTVTQTGLSYSNSKEKLSTPSFNYDYIKIIYELWIKIAKLEHLEDRVPNIRKKKHQSNVKTVTEQEDEIWELYDTSGNLLAYGDEYQINSVYEIVSTLYQNFVEFQKQMIVKELALDKSLNRLIELEKILNEQKNELELKINDFISIPLYSQKCKYIKMVK